MRKESEQFKVCPWGHSCRTHVPANFNDMLSEFPKIFYPSKPSTRKFLMIKPD